MAYTNSPLVAYTKISPNRTSPRNHVIDTITIHCVVGQCSIETLGNIFAPSSRQASSNYGVGVDGRIGMYCEEKDRSWCTSSGSNDNRAITIEVASDTFHPYKVNDKAYNALIELCADICKRNGIKKLLWKEDKSLIGQVSKQNMTVHRWFANKSCPGDYLYNLHGAIAEAVNAKIGNSSDNNGNSHINENMTSQTTWKEDSKQSYTGSTNEQTIFNYLTKVMKLNTAAACGVLANFAAESAFNPKNLQQTYEKKLGFTDESYTKAVNDGSYTNFVKDSAGYGLAQWTYWSRKQSLLNYAKKVGYSIGGLNMQLDFFAQEIKGYKTVWNCLTTVPNTAEGAYKAAHTMCYTYEAPAAKETSSVTRGNAAKNNYWKKYGVVTPEVSESTKTLYRVQTGAYAQKGNATALCNSLKADGFDAIIVTVGKYFKVQVGAYAVKANADAMMKKLKAAGYPDAFITSNAKTSLETSSSSEIKKGDKVKVTKAVTYTGNSFKLYYSTYDVLEINGDRVVIGIGKTVTAAVNKANLQKV